MLICIFICIYLCKVYLCFLLHFLENSLQRIWPCFSILGLQKFLESAIGQSMVVKIEHFFLQQKCSWNVTDVLKHRSTDHWLRWVVICVLESWYLLPTQLKAFWWNCSLFLEVSEAKGAKISAPWWANSLFCSEY